MNDPCQFCGAHGVDDGETLCGTCRSASRGLLGWVAARQDAAYVRWDAAVAELEAADREVAVVKAMLKTLARTHTP